MAKFKAEPQDARTVRDILDRYDGLAHLRVTNRGDLLTVVSGPQQNPVKHTRLRRVTVHYWQVEMPSHSRWEPTPFRGDLEEIVPAIVQNFPWMLQDTG